MKSLKTLLILLSYLYSDSFSVAILPNEIYFGSIKKSSTIKSINESNVSLILFTGDSKDGSSKCSNDVIGKRVRDYFDSLNAPLLYALGDNEWTDCHRKKCGSFNPIERLEYLRRYFFATPYSQGKKPIKLQRMKNFPENARVVFGGIMFVTFNIVGSNNGFIKSKKQCSKRSNRSWGDCKESNIEFRLRDGANIKWLKESLTIASKSHIKGVVLIFQADMFYKYNLANRKDIKKLLKQKNGYSRFLKALMDSSIDYRGKILIVHGGTHYFRVDFPFSKIFYANSHHIMRVEGFGDIDDSWVRLDIDTSSDTIFRVTPITK